MRARPIGVTILAILAFLMGLIYLLMAAGSFLVAVLPLEEWQGIGRVPEFIADNAGIIFTSLGVLFLILAIVSFLLSYGFFKGRPWAWTLGIILGVLSIISSVINLLLYWDISNLSSTIISILIAVLLIFYLTRPGVKRYFRG
ncbi:MAG: hypothetical protein GKC03_07520 [Methanomassiliicoccales archaeon]|nr:hypothetical protein [Methanomassiliicoccales archaeon]NYT15004.1 hypothetical protein [Methanomassiliicoccales archaeon]